MQFERLTKIVHVTDPECWYGEDSVEVSLFVTNEYEGRVYVRVFIASIDDFAVAYDVDCNAENEAQIRWAYNHLKTWLYDKMPDEIDLGWLFEHGYMPY